MFKRLIRFLSFFLLRLFGSPLFDREWDELIFRDRNKKYGAFELRRLASTYQSLGLVITLGIVILFTFYVFIKPEKTKPAEFEFQKMIEYKGFDANLMEVKPLKKEQAPPPAEIKKEKTETSADKNLPPEVKEDVLEKKMAKKPAAADTLVKAKSGTDTSGKADAQVDSGLVEEVYAEGPASAYGGLAEFMKWVQQNLVVPKEAIDNNVHGTVYVHFTIDEKGALTKITLSKGIGYGCDQAVVDVLNRAPKWKPAVRDGKAVSQRFIIPVKI